MTESVVLCVVWALIAGLLVWACLEWVFDWDTHRSKVLGGLTFLIVLALCLA